MSVELNHTIVHATDKHTSAEQLAGLLGLEVQPEFGPFVPVATSNDVGLDFADAGDRPVTPQHYAFLVSEDEFDTIFSRIRQADIRYFADPHQQQPGEINRRDGGRGVYWADRDGHIMEILTRPYGSGDDNG